MQNSAGAGNVGHEERIPIRLGKVGGPLDAIRTQGRAGKAEVHVLAVALNAGFSGGCEGLLDRGEKWIDQVRLMVLGQFPDHDAAKMIIPSVTDFALAGAFVVVGDEHVGIGTGIINRQIGALCIRVPAIKVWLIVGGHDRVERLLARGWGRCPGLARERSPARRGSAAAGPNPGVKGDADAYLARRHAGSKQAADHSVGGGDETTGAWEAVTPIIDGRVEPCDPAGIRSGEVVSHQIDLVELDFDGGDQACGRGRHRNGGGQQLLSADGIHRQPETVNEVRVLLRISGVQRLPINVNAVVAAAGHEIYEIGDEGAAIGNCGRALEPGLAARAANTEKNLFARGMGVGDDVGGVTCGESVDVAIQGAVRIWHGREVDDVGEGGEVYGRSGHAALLPAGIVAGAPEIGAGGGDR